MAAAASLTANDPAQDPTAASKPKPAPKPKSKKRSRPNAAHTLAAHTLRRPTWTYLHLRLLSSPPPDAPPSLLAHRQRLTAALSQFLGLHGAAIPVDILKHDGADLWIRVPREDGAAVVAAVSGWVGAVGDGDGDGGAGRAEVAWWVKGRGDWLGALVGGEGWDLFSGG